MRRESFERPTEHYDEKIEAIDEQICHLIKQRKDLSKNDAGFPTNELISAWAEKYGLYEDFLNGLFGHFLHEEMYRPTVEPQGFLRNIPILKSFEKDDLFYSVTFVRQFENASIVHLNIDRDDSDDMPGVFVDHDFLELSIEDGKGTAYDCRNVGGGGTGGHTSYQFIVSPPLPDDLSEIEWTFKAYETPFGTKPTAFEFVVKMD